MPKKPKVTLESHPKVEDNLPPKSATQKPTARTLVGGESWTGKLPVNILSEYCQKNKWEKPEYSMHRERNGFISFVTLRKKRPKSDDVFSLPTLKVPQSMKDVATRSTAVEARNFAAAATLFRVCNRLSLQTMMPPQYRDLWKGEFIGMKSLDIECGYGWMYEADPFVAHKRHNEQQELAKKHAQTNTTNIQKPNHAQAAQGIGQSIGIGHKLPKAWLNAPRIELGKKARQQAEKLIRRNAIWNPQGLIAHSDLKARLVENLTCNGFRKSHAEEAVDVCQNYAEALEWLNIYVPENDLPKWCLPEAYGAGVSKASDDPKKDIVIEKLSSAGFAPQICAMFYDECLGDETGIASKLQDTLLYGSEAVVKNAGPDVKSEEVGSDDDGWEGEISIISAIYGDRCKVISEEQIQVTLFHEATEPLNITVCVRKPHGPYPHVLPILTVHAPLPAYIRLSISKRALMYAKEHILGSQMVFSIIDWIQQEVPNIISNPGRLSDLIPQVSFRNVPHRLANDKVSEGLSGHSTLREATHTNRHIRKELRPNLETDEYQKILRMRESLPAWKMRQSIIQAVDQHQVVLISGETGSGKSTQAVQFILDDMIGKNLGSSANIICTQPRRISAISLAERVAQERCSIVGNEVGFAIRGERKVRKGITKLVYMTTGVLLRKFQATQNLQTFDSGVARDVSHVFIDEVHERSVETDVLLLILKELLKQNKALKIILMSATADADLFENYFSSICLVGKIDIEGRTHPVQDIYLEDVLLKTNLRSLSNGRDIETPDEPFDRQMGRKIGMNGSRLDYGLIGDTVHLINSDLGDGDGSILIFLPGIMEIDKVIRILKNFKGIQCFPLHSSLPSSDQRKVFARLPKGRRKVIVATNIAETSITIDDAVAVIDTGRVKEMVFDSQTKTARLVEVWASKASCKQRKGRAGRVRAGKCYKLYSRHLEAGTMRDRTEPEILRLPLEQLCLSVKVMGIDDVFQFFREAITHPNTSAIEDALKALHQVGALKENKLTALGRHMAFIPADLRCSKLLIYGATFGCLEASLTIAAILTSKSPFISTGDHREEAKAARSSFAKGKGDLLCDLCAYETWQKKKCTGVTTTTINTWCKANLLSLSTLEDIASNKTYFLSSLIEARWVPAGYTSSTASDSSLNSCGSNHTLLQALLAAALNPQIARICLPEKKFAAGIAGSIEMDPEARKIKYFDRYNDRVFLHPGSTLFDAQGHGNASFISFWAKMQTSKCFVREVTPLNAYSLLLFCGSITYDESGKGLIVDGWWKLRGWMRIGVLVSKLRMILDDLLNQKADDPALDISSQDVVTLSRRLIELNGLDN